MRVCIGGPLDGKRIADSEPAPAGYDMNNFFMFASGLDYPERRALINANYRPRLTEYEILQRARRACADSAVPSLGTSEGYLKGLFDTSTPMASVVRALRDLDKPFVDPVDEKLRALVPVDDAADIALLRKAYEMGRSDVG